MENEQPLDQVPLLVGSNVSASEPSERVVHPELLAAIDQVVRLAGALGLVRTLPPVLTIDEVAELLNLDRKSVLKAIEARQIPGVRRFGTTFRVLTAALVNWMAKGRGELQR